MAVGRIGKEWMDNCLSNADKETIEGWFELALNADKVEIFDDLKVAADDRWLGQDQIDAKCALIDQGV